MKKDNVVQTKSFDFALKVIETYLLNLGKEKADHLLSCADELIRIIGTIQKTLKIKLGILK